MKTTTPPAMINGVSIPVIEDTVNAIVAQPELGAFRFRASNHLVEGGLNRSKIGTFHGAGAEHRLDKVRVVFED